jgi:DNA polymerase-3 subunit beta
MDFTVKTTDFLKALTIVDGVITSREIKSTLSNIKIDIYDDSVSLSASDMELSMKVKVHAHVGKKGSISITSKQLSNIFKTITFPESKIEVKQENDNFITYIKDASGNKKSTFQINGTIDDDRKIIPDIDTSKYIIFPCHTIKEMFKKTLPFVATDDQRFAYNGIFIKMINSQLVMAGTDGRRLAEIKRTVPEAFSWKDGIIVAHKAIREILKMTEFAETGKIGIYEDQLFIEIGNHQLLSKLIDGTFPAYEAVIPKKSNHEVILGRDEFSENIKQAMVSAEEPTKQIRLEFKKNILSISSNSPGSMGFNSALAITYSGDDTSISLRGDYISEAIKVIDELELIFKFNDALSPISISMAGDPDFISVIMPMRS